MLKHISLTIDGAKISVPEGSTVLDAALDYGICIPNLCHVRTLKPIGVCRVCVVEVVQNGRSRITASCALQAKEGMVIRAHSPKVIEARRVVAEMLVAEAPNSRAIQDLAVKCGVTDVRFPFRNKDCVLCGRCVRACSEEWRSRSLGFVGRGNSRRVALPFDKRPEFCKRCWTCIDVCPMTITPCKGPIKAGEEFLCGQCESQLSMAENIEDTCTWCTMGEGFQCARWAGAAMSSPQ
jgi:NADH dehydrogenase/NADH:ubiquinone oxidoreductase subunit G